jgi:hypothetical protein
MTPTASGVPAMTPGAAGQRSPAIGVHSRTESTVTPGAE